MSDHATGRFWSGIDIPKTIAGTLAAVSAAFLGSFLGVAGTMIGAALAALISSIGTEVYHRSINRGTKQLQAAFVVAPAAVGTPSVEAAADASPSEEPVSPAAPAPSGDQPERRIHWKRVALVTGVFFLLGMGVLTTAELFAGRSAADVTSGRDNGSPTILFDTADEHRDDEESPVVVPSRTPATTTSEAPAPTGPDTATTTPAGPAPTSEGPVPTTPAETTPPDQNETGQGETGQGETGQGQTGGDTGTGTGREQPAEDSGTGE
ncbi:hypothetical protein [Actinoplanes xinjiangensis]|uniref:Uncharacterized protein n=1 Tax=Actinoplanes xinjiangensis TaxID=512350 RepID=A0A316FUW4_9ACTN|nr:hypothetical protein [Actinoplanes xinjiangensis]PWK51466.1 hypothetical protein BC793_102495 [Actinoplanes xinjiangensis]GIF35825.1 hypothetical protein Axi01nite_01360 [Actinoplanes xinjiangensis]